MGKGVGSSSTKMNARPSRSGSTKVAGLHYCSQPNCSQSFKFKKDLSRHEMVHTGVKPFLCPKSWCNASSATKYGLERHLKNVHKTPSGIIKQEVDAAGTKCLLKMGVVGAVSVPGNQISSTIRKLVLEGNGNKKNVIGTSTPTPDQKTVTAYFSPTNQTCATSTTTSSSEAN